MRYSLYDPKFSVKYTEQGELIIYEDNNEIAQEIIKGLEKENQVMVEAVSLLNKMYESHNYTSSTVVAKMFNMLRGSVHYLIANHLIFNYHYISIGDKKFFTPEGIAAIENNQRERKD